MHKTTFVLYRLAWICKWTWRNRWTAPPC